jgi:vacuolar-type H+-ATPase subunit I/STV1
MIANAVTSIVDWGKTIISETLDKVNEYNPVAIGFQAAHDKKMAEFAERDIKTEAELKVARARAAERAKERERDKASGKELSPLEQRIEDRRERNKTTAAAITTANTSIDPKLDEQTNLINLQNQILLQLLGTSKEQLNVTKKQKPTVIADTNNTQSNVSANLNNAFSTSKQDSRGMYTSSPYSLSPA